MIEYQFESLGPVIHILILMIVMDCGCLRDLRVKSQFTPRKCR